MTGFCRSAVLALALALVSAPLGAQQDTEPQVNDSPGEAGPPPADPPPEQAPDPQAQDQPSPFDYEASEEISEDLSVSFPVDI